MKTCRKIFIIIAFICCSFIAKADGWPANYGGVMLQAFYWDGHDDSKWTVLQSQADELSSYFDIIWVPNSGKSSGSPSMGYTPIYWFTNHNSDFGSESQLRSMINNFKSKGVNVIMDLVINHRNGVNNWADFPAETWNGTTYQMNASHVCRTDEWSRNGGSPTGANDTGDDFDGARDLDHTNATVQQHCKKYCEFLLTALGYAGFRIDMVKGYRGEYTKMYNQYAKPRFSVGEYWDGYDNIAGWIESTGKESAAFDFPFKYALNSAMNYGGQPNMEALCWLAGGTDPQPAGLIHHNYRKYAVTFIDNHDTYRNDGKFTGNILAAHAFMLCSPGTPCVFLKHWMANKAKIKKMIAIRKACGVTNTSSVKVLKHTSDCYMAEVTGNKGKLVVKIGSAWDSPSGYSSSDIKDSGTDYCIWANVDVPDAPGPVDSGEYSVYWDNSGAKWTTPKVHYFGGVSSSSWPGANMTLVSGSTTLYKYTVPSGTTGVVFNNGSGTQTDDLNAIPGHLYNISGDRGEFVDDGNGNSKNIVYWDNKDKNWADPHIYYWGAGSPEWPGVSMQKLNGQFYYYELPAGTTGMSFNAGDGDLTKTGDMTTVAGHDYNQNGDQGTHIPSTLYVQGYVNGGAWDSSKGVALTRDGAIFTGQIEVNTPGDSRGFSLSTVIGSSWTTVNAGNRYGSLTDDDLITPGIPKTVYKYTKNTTASGTKRWDVAPGIYYVSVDFERMSLTLMEMSIALNKNGLSLNVGESESLVATTYPGDLPDVPVTWTSSNTSVATVSTAGKVTAKSKGTAVITAHYGDKLSAECTVYVGKTKQTILWTQEIPAVAKGSSVNFTASATSGLPVSYVITSGANNGHFDDDGAFVGDLPGSVTVEARQAGDDTYGPADPVSKTVIVTLGYVEGDANGDNKVNITDATSIISYVLGRNPSPFNVEAADINGDGRVNVVDAVRIFDLILPAAPSPKPRREQAENDTAPEQFELTVTGNDLEISFSNMDDYIATQFDLILPAGCEVTGASVSGSGHRVVYRKASENVTRVAVYSMSNAEFASSGCIKLTLSSVPDGDVEITNAIINSDDNGTIKEFAALGTGTTVTGIETLGIDDDNTWCEIYSIDGICVYSGSVTALREDMFNGVYLVKMGGKVYKALLR